MKAPADIAKLTLIDPEDLSDGAYPPLGFIPVSNVQLGNGDYYGLYWPYGREKAEPIVCVMAHDGLCLLHAYSSAAVFVRWLEANGGDYGEVDVEDPRSIQDRTDQAQKRLASGDPQGAVNLLQAVVEDFPEDAEAWFKLSQQLRRLGDAAGAADAAIRSFTSNWAFGPPPERVLQTLHRIRDTHDDDPVVAHCQDISLRFGGTKTNDTYLALQRVVDGYFERNEPQRALLMRQNYAAIMMTETYSFRERYAFDVGEWFEEQTALCEHYLGDSRLTAR